MLSKMPLLRGMQKGSRTVLKRCVDQVAGSKYIVAGCNKSCGKVKNSSERISDEQAWQITTKILRFVWGKRKIEKHKKC